MLTILYNLGGKLVGFYNHIVTLVSLGYLSMKVLIVNRNKGRSAVLRVIVMQTYFTGYQALLLVSILALMVGGVVIIQASIQLSKFGGLTTIGEILTLTIIREIGPLITALIVIARSGTAIASELGSMRVNKEVQALEVMGISPIEYIIAPRVLGGVLSVACLALYFDVVALIGGSIVAKGILSMPFSYFVEKVSLAITFDDVLIFLIKNIIGASIIFLVACYHGFNVKFSPTEIPIATTKTVVNALFFCFFFYGLVSALFFIKKYSTFTM